MSNSKNSLSVYLHVLVLGGGGGGIDLSMLSKFSLLSFIINR